MAIIVGIEWNQLQKNETNTPVTRIETIPQSTPDPIVESSYFPGSDELERDARKFHNCYSDDRGPDIPIGLPPSDSENENYLKELVIVFARSLATPQINNIINISDDSESGPGNKSDDSEIITTYTRNPEESHIYRFNMAILQCKQLTLGFAQNNHTWDQIQCPCSSSMEGWMRTYGCEINVTTLVRCDNRNYTPQGYLEHVKSKNPSSYHHYFIEKYLTK